MRDSVLLLLAVLTAYGQVASPVSTSVNLHIAGDARPLATAADRLQARLGVPINYEDPQYVDESEIEDVAREVVRDDCYSAIPPCRVLIPKRSRLSGSIMTTGVEPSAAVRAAINLHHQNRNPGIFRLLTPPDSFTIVGSQVKGPGGQMIASFSPLDRLVSIAPQKRSAYEFVRLVCELVSQWGVKVELVSYPTNLFTQMSVDIGADNQPARTVLLRAYASLHWADPDLVSSPAPKRRLVWRLFYGPAEKAYYMNVEVPMKEQAHPAANVPSLVSQDW